MSRLLARRIVRHLIVVPALLGIASMVPVTVAEAQFGCVEDRRCQTSPSGHFNTCCTWIECCWVVGCDEAFLGCETEGVV